MRIRETLFADSVEELQHLCALYERQYHFSEFDTQQLEAGVNDGFCRYFVLYERLEKPIQRKEYDE